MTTAYYLVGPPGVGKSSALECIIARHPAPGPMIRPPGFGTFGYEQMGDEAFYLGRHRPGFPGTDALAYSCLPFAEAWAMEAPLPQFVYGEGARLAHNRFLLPLSRRAQLTVVLVTAHPDVLAARRASRFNTQSASWMKGADTRARNAADRAAAAGIPVVVIDSGHLDPGQVAARILQH